MRIFIISHDLSHNCLGRAVLLSQVFGRQHEVVIVGGCFGPEIWYPCRNIGIKYRKVNGELFLPQYTHQMARLLDKLKGGMVLAVKPRPTSFGLALMHRELRRRPVLLDIDDDEMAFYRDANWRKWDRKTLLRRPNSPLYTAMLERAIPFADAITVASRTLQDRHGGTYLTHVKDPDVLDPSRFDRDAERRKRNLPLEEKIIVFAGSPREHKGLELLLDVIERIGRDDLRLLVVGATNNPDDEYECRLREIGGERLYMLKQIPFTELPSVLAMADLVVLPQMDTETTRTQMPSKLFDAMSMALPIVATGVSDIPEVLAGECGMIVPPENEGALADAVCEVLESPSLAERLGANARQRLIERYSIDSAQDTVKAVVERTMEGRHAHAPSQ